MLFRSLQAVLNIDAEYLVKNVDLTSIANNRVIEDLLVKSKINGVLQKPGFDLSLKLSDKSSNKDNFAINNKFNQYKADENDINRQVVSLLLTGQLSQDQGFLNTGGLSSIVTGTLGGYVSSWLTGILNKQLEKVTKGIVSIAVDVNPSLNAQTLSTIQTQIRGSLQARLHKNIKIYLGSSFDLINNPLTQLYGNRLLPDITLEWIINKDGSIRILANNKSTIDLTGKRNKSSVQLAYKKDVDRFGDFFRSKKRIAYLDSLMIAKELIYPIPADTTK